MKPVSVTFDEFLQPFFNIDETVNIRIFDDKKSGTFKEGDSIYGLPKTKVIV